MDYKGSPSRERVLTRHRTIHDISPIEWNRLAGTNAFASHAWLAAAESCARTPAEPIYFVEYDGRAIRAGAVAYVVSRSLEDETLDDMVFGRLSKAASAIGFSMLPALVCGPRLGYGWHIGVDSGIDRDAADHARRAILDAMEAEASARGLDLSFAHVMTHERELSSLLAARAYLRCTNVPVAVLDVEWNSFDAYLDRLSGKRRREFKRQINRSREDGTVVEISDRPPEDDGRLLALLDDNARRHNSASFAFGPGWLSMLAGQADMRIRLGTATRNGRVTGVSLMLVLGDAGYATAVGVDHAAGGEFTYFQVLYNALIADAIDLGLRRLYYGRGMYDVKLRRGCTLETTWIVTRAAGARRMATAAWYRLASSWNRYKLPRRARQLLSDRTMA